MQPRTVGAKTHCLIELEATIPECVYNVIKTVPGMPVLPFAQYTNLVAFHLRVKNSAPAVHFYERMGSDAFP